MKYRPPATPEQTRQFELANVHNYHHVVRFTPHDLPSRACAFRSLAELMSAVRDSGNGFFTDLPHRVFDATPPTGRLRFFVTSESGREPGEREYRIWYVSAVPGTRELRVNPLRTRADNLTLARSFAADAHWACPAPVMRARRIG